MRRNDLISWMLCAEATLEQNGYGETRATLNELIQKISATQERPILGSDQGCSGLIETDLEHRQGVSVPQSSHPAITKNLLI
jgi:hypothetical protein